MIFNIYDNIDFTEPLSFKIRALLGKPGTGKTTAIQEKISNDPNYCFLTASTGQAAYNLASNIKYSLNTACTVHSALGIKDVHTLISRLENASIFNEFRKIAKNTNLLMIDEISLIDERFFTTLCLALQTYNCSMTDKSLNLLVVGDFGQLPCVNGNPVFYSPYWAKTNVIKFTKIWRQTNLEFINALDLLRENKASDENCVGWIADNIGFEDYVDSDFKGTTIFTSNKEVDSYNLMKLDELPLSCRTYESIIQGKPPTLTKYVPDQLHLKEGALITIQVNNFNKGYVNGSLGIIVNMYNSKIEVELLDGGRVTLGYHSYENIDNKTGDIIGSISQIPVRLAWASTLHKIQGATLDSIQIKLARKGKREFLSYLHGGLATALSRSRTPEGIRLIGNKEDFIHSNFIDPRYINFM